MSQKSQSIQLFVSAVIVIVILFFGGLYFLKKEKNFLIIPSTVANARENVDLTPEKRAEIQQEIDKLEKQIAQDPNNLDPYWSLAIQRRRLGDLRGAAEVYVRAIKQNPAFYLGYANLGVMYKLMGEYDLAEEAMKEAIIRNPQKPNPYLKLGELYQYYFPKRQSEIEALYLQALKKVRGENNKTPIVQALAQYYYNNKQWEKALEYYQLLVDKYGIDQELLGEVFDELDAKLDQKEQENAY